LFIKQIDQYLINESERNQVLEGFSLLNQVLESLAESMKIAYSISPEK